MPSEIPIDLKKKKNSLFLAIAIIAFITGLLTPRILYVIPALVIIVSCVISLIKREKLWGLSVFLIIGTIYLMNSTSLNIGSFSNTQTKKDQEDYALQKMNILNEVWEVSWSNGYGHVKGRVKNNGDKVVSYFKITARFYDNNHQVINSEYTNSGEDLYPTEAKDFEISHKASSEYKTVNLTVEEIRIK